LRSKRMDGRVRRPPGAIVTNALVIDVLSSGEAWFGSNRIASKSAYPELNAARSLRGLGIDLETPVTFREMGIVTKYSTLGFVLRSDNNAPVFA
jgi:hypothetical protein